MLIGKNAEFAVAYGGMSTSALQWWYVKSLVVCQILGGMSNTDPITGCALAQPNSSVAHQTQIVHLSILPLEFCPALVAVLLKFTWLL